MPTNPENLVKIASVLSEINGGIYQFFSCIYFACVLNGERKDSEIFNSWEQCFVYSKL